MRPLKRMSHHDTGKLDTEYFYQQRKVSRNNSFVTSTPSIRFKFMINFVTYISNELLSQLGYPIPLRPHNNARRSSLARSVLITEH